MRLKQIAIASLVVNLFFVFAGAFFVYQKGGFSYISAVVSGEKDSYYLDRTSIFSAYNDTGGIVFLGDSLTDFNEWSEMFPGVSVVNRGIKSDTAEGVLKRLNEIIKLKPQKVFIMIGTNDVGEGIEISEFTRNYEKIIDQLSGTQVYIQSVLPVNEDMLHANRNKRIQEFNESLRQLSLAQNVTYVDLYANMVDDQGQLKPELTHDGLHLNARGYAIWKEQIERHIQ